MKKPKYTVNIELPIETIRLYKKVAKLCKLSVSKTVLVILVLQALKDTRKKK